MLLGADTLVPVTDALVAKVRAQFGQPPIFWGRYFKKPDFPEDYQPAIENVVFANNNLRLLPIARQTGRVGGSVTDGADDALLNAAAFTQSLGVEHLAKIGGEFLMFLDVEGTSAKNPNVSVEYWIGWSAALVAQSRRISGGRFTMVPGIYCRQNQSPTWDAIARAHNLGFPCTGAWVFRAHNDACTKAVPGWESAFNTPAAAPPCPIMLWQFAIDCIFDGGVDFDMLNPDPATAAALLNRLAFPPAS